MNSPIDLDRWRSEKKAAAMENFIEQVRAVLASLKIGDYGNASSALEAAKVSDATLRRLK